MGSSGEEVAEAVAEWLREQPKILSEIDATGVSESFADEQPRHRVKAQGSGS